MNKLLLLIIALCCQLPVAAQDVNELNGTAFSVSDGDTLKLHTIDRRVITIRLYGIDTLSKYCHV